MNLKEKRLDVDSAFVSTCAGSANASQTRICAVADDAIRVAV